jgi:hypothetical protein
MLLKLEDYDPELHGMHDDCDYVISVDDMHEEFAKIMIDHMGYKGMYQRYGEGLANIDGHTEFYLCHS